MKQLDLFEDSKPKIYESPDKGKTIYERDFGSIERREIKSSAQQQWNIAYKENT